MTILGLPILTFLLNYGAGIIECIITLIIMILGIYEGKKVQEKYGEENWYRTWG